MRQYRFWFTMLFLGFGFFWLGFRASSAAPKAENVTLIRAASGQVSFGTELTLPIEAVGVDSLGAATVKVTFDPTVISVARCQRNAVFDVGLCNTEYDGNGDGIADAVLFNVVSLDGVKAGTGGAIVLSEITWLGLKVPNDTETAIGIEVMTLTDSDALPIDYATEDGQIMVLAEVKPSPTPTPTATPTPKPSAVMALHLPVVVVGRQPKPTPGVAPQFVCSDWCTPGSKPNYWRQIVNSDKAVDDWRLYNGMAFEYDLHKETAVSAVAEAKEGQSVRIDAFYNGAWLLACKSVVVCSVQGGGEQPGWESWGGDISINKTPSLAEGEALSSRKGEFAHE